MKRLFTTPQPCFPGFISFFQYVALVTFCFFVLIADSQAAHIQQLRLGDHPDKSRLVIEMSDKLDYNVFMLPSPQRLVIDFKGRNLSCAALSPVENKRIKFSRKNEDAQTLRLVFDVKQAVAIKSKFFLPASGGKPNRLVVDLVPASNKAPMQFAAKKNLKVSPAAARPRAAAKSVGRASIAPSPSAIKRSKPPSAQKHVIVIDPGHGGKDPGAVGAGKLFEKKVVLATAKKLKTMLEASGRYKVYLTRSDDRYIRLYERVRIARRHNADMFVSIHADSVENSSVKGASVYTLSEKASDTQTAKLAARENKSDVIAGVDLSDEGHDVAAILIDLALRDTKNQSTFLANQFIDAFKAHNIKTLRTPLHSAGFAVLKAPDIPSVLVEIGFMSNRVEANMLNTRSHQGKIARALMGSIDSYFAKQTHYTD